MLPFYKKLSYAMGRTGSSLLLTTVDFAGLLIYYFYFDLDPLRAGLAIAIGYIVIGLTHWLTGFYSDRIKTRFGRRKPFVILGAPILAITAFLYFVPYLFIHPSPAPRFDPIYQHLMFSYNILFISLFKFGYAFLLTAYQAWLPEITEPEERPTVAAMQQNANWIGDGMGLVLSFLTGVLFISGTLTEMGFIVVISVCVLEVILYLPCIAFIREPPEISAPKRSLFHETKAILSNRTYIGFLITVGFWSLSLSVVTNTAVQMAQNGLQLPLIELLIAAIALVLGVLLSLYLWGYLSKRFGKRQALSVALILLTIILPFTFVLGLPSLIPRFTQVIIWAIALAVGIAALYLFRYITIADIAHVDRIKTGKSRAGIYEGFQGVPLNFFQAIGSTLIGLVLLFGEVIPGQAIPNYGYFLWGPIFAPYLLIAFLILQLLNIDPDFKALEKQLTSEPGAA